MSRPPAYDDLPPAYTPPLISPEPQCQRPTATSLTAHKSSEARLQSGTDDSIALLPLTSTPDPSSDHILQRALRDYTRQRTASEWGRYRHGTLLSSQDDEPGLVAWLIWLVNFMALPDDIVVNGAWRSGAGAMTVGLMT